MEKNCHLLDHTSKNFAKIDTSIFKKTPVDLAAIADSINSE